MIALLAVCEVSRYFAGVYNRPHVLVDEMLLVGANRQMNPGSRHRTNRPFAALDANKDEDGYAHQQNRGLLLKLLLARSQRG